jgi:serine/threonine-protein kinase
VHVLLQVCHSLGEAHAASMVHRDIKPANIFVCRYGRDLDFVKVLDFGLVKQQEPPGDPALTQEGQFLGTPAFIAPEMAIGSDVDGRADIYSLGCVAYWLLTGSLVFESDNVMALAAKHLSEKPVPPSRHTGTDVPPDLENVILDCLRKDPADRPQSVEELADRLSRCDIPAWTTRDAEIWWEQRAAAGPDPRARGPGTVPTSPSG